MTLRVFMPRTDSPFPPPTPSLALAQAADQFMIDHLKQLCERALQHVVNQDTVDILQELADRTNALQLREICAHFTRNHRSPSLGGVALRVEELEIGGDTPAAMMD